MRIDKIEIDGFGKLNNFSLEFRDGFNLLIGENESGKSTICEFLLSMFYDMPNDGKRAIASDMARKKYRPWKSESFGGRVFFTDDNGKQYILEKSFGTTKRGDRAKLLDADTWSECGSGENAGERFFGLSREGFLRSFYIKSLGLSESGSEEILSKLSNMETTGDEDVSYDNIKNALEKEIYGIITKTGRGGKLILLKDELVSLESELARANLLRETVKEDAKTLEEFKNEELELSKKQAELKKKQLIATEREKYEAYISAKDAKAVLEKRLESEKERKEALSLKLADKKSKALAKISDEDIDVAKECERQLIILENKKEEQEKRQEEIATKNKKRRKMLLLVGVLIFVILTSVGIFIKKVPLMAASGLILGIAVFLLGRKSTPDDNAQEKVDRDIQAEIEKKKSLLEKYGVNSLEELYDEARAQENTLSLIESIKLQMDNSGREIEALEKSIAEFKMPEEVSFSENYVNGGTESSKDILLQLDVVGSRLKTVSRGILELSEKLAGQNAMMRSVSDIKSDIEGINAQISALSKKLSSYKKAYEWIEKAHLEIKLNYAPALNKKVAEIFEILTCGKYDSVKVGENFDLNYKNEFNEITKPMYLSSGAYDLLYISLRLASLSLICEGKIPPVILDDAFIQLDDKRLKVIVDFLKSNEKFSQVIAFTCHEENAKIVDNKNLHIIKLENTEAV